MRKQRLLLVGGGHAHLFVLEALRASAGAWSDRLEVAMVSSSLQTAYTGMLPGLIAGHYRPSESHIDLKPLAQRAGVTLVRGTAHALDLANNTLGIRVEGAQAAQQTAEFDILSLDVGSAPAFAGIPGAAEHAIPLKPTEAFLPRWRALQDRIAQASHPVHVVTVGGGPGGAELALAMAHRMAACRDRVKWSLVTSNGLLPGYPRRAARMMERRLAQAGIALRTRAQVSSVAPGRLGFADGSSAACDAVLWVAGAAPQAWIAGSGLACVDGGFIHINGCLQSVSHPHVFAAGDAATDPERRRPKAGVFAVRQGPVLAANLLQFAVGGPLAVYRPQRAYLSLISTGGRHALAAWRGMSFQGDWVWRWKDRIDRRFIDRFSPPS